MKREEAQALVGRSVSLWTAANGQYVGVLQEVLPTRPWRAKALITGVLSAATHYERGGVCRRGFRPGEVLEVGGASVKPTEAVGTDYLSALERAKDDHEKWLAADPAGQHSGLHQAAGAALALVMDAERRRLEGETPWRLDRQAERCIPASGGPTASARP